MAENLSKDYDRVEVCPDSGCFRMAAPRSFAPRVKSRESEASMKGVHYRVANNGLIPKLGDVSFMG